MAESVSKTSLLTLFILSLMPPLLIYATPALWAFTDIAIFIFFSIWGYSIVKKLVTKSKHQIKTTKFTTVLILAAIYISLLGTYFAFTYTKNDDPELLLPIIIIGQFLLFLAGTYSIRFFARTIAMVELGRNARFSEYAGYLVMLICFPFGIWWLYPKIMSLIEP